MVKGNYILLSVFKQRKGKPGLISLLQDEQGLSITHSQSLPDNAITIKLCEYLPIKDNASFETKLIDYVDQHALRGTECAWVLRPVTRGQVSKLNLRSN